MARESSLWKWLSGVRRAQGPDFQIEIQRIENMLAAGPGDVEGVAVIALEEPSVWPFWIELKSSPRPARPATPVRFKLKGREAQIEFMGRRWSLGQCAVWLLQVGEGPDRMLYVLPGDKGPLLTPGIPEAELAVLCATEGGRIFNGRSTPRDVIEGAISCRRNSPIRK